VCGTFTIFSKGLIMKKIALIAAVASALLVPFSAAQAATAAGNFDVNITLTSVCLLTTSAATTDLNFAYSSFQGGAQAATGGAFSLRCTNGLTPTSFALDSTTVTDAATNLTYTLTLPTPLAGTGLAQTYTMAAGQSGTCATASCTNTASANKQRTLTITY
jgi:hypothetical protein